jgi:hypothetical protein
MTTACVKKELPGNEFEIVTKEGTSYHGPKTIDASRKTNQKNNRKGNQNEGKKKSKKDGGQKKTIPQNTK